MIEEEEEVAPKKEPTKEDILKMIDEFIEKNPEEKERLKQKLFPEEEKPPKEEVVEKEEEKEPEVEEKPHQKEFSVLDEYF